MPPNDFQKQIDQIKQTLVSHQHSGSDFTQKLRTQDFNLIARTSLSVAGTTLTLDGISPRRFLRVYIQHGAKASNGNTLLRFNNDSGNNYTSISRENNTARTSQSSIDLMDQLNNTTVFFYVIDILNLFGTQKSVVSEGIQIPTSATTSQVTRQVYGTWINTTSSITRIDIVSSGGNFPVDTFLEVYGSKN